MILHIWALHVPGNNNPIGISVKSKQILYPSTLYYGEGRVFAVDIPDLVFYFIFFAPNVLGHADNYIPANPLVTPAHIVPEWYMLPFMRSCERYLTNWRQF